MTESSPPPIPGKTYDLVTDVKPEAIVIHCSDPRFQPAFAQFLRDELHLSEGQYIPIVVGGGAGVLAHPERLPKEFKFLRDRLEQYRGSIFPSARRIILINHEGCRYYEGLKKRALGFIGSQKVLARQPHDDLSAVVRIFARVLPHLGVTLEPYYARFADDSQTRIVFEKIPV